MIDASPIINPFERSAFLLRAWGRRLARPPTNYFTVWAGFALARTQLNTSNSRLSASMKALSDSRRSFPVRVVVTLAFSWIALSAIAADLDPVLRGHWPLSRRVPALALPIQNGYAFV